MLDHASWPQCQCLVTIAMYSALLDLEMRRSAVCTPSLVNLSLNDLLPNNLPMLAHLSNLRSLSSVAIRMRDVRQRDQLPALPLHLLSGLPPGLTHLLLSGLRLDPTQPMMLGALESLELDRCMVPSLGALSGCPSLTRLTMIPPSWQAGQLLSWRVPAPIGCRDGPRLLAGLRSLHLCMPGSGTVEWVEQLEGLTSLALENAVVGTALGGCVCMCPGS
jgi:hypothetical protein